MRAFVLLLILAFALAACGETTVPETAQDATGDSVVAGSGDTTAVAQAPTGAVPVSPSYTMAQVAVHASRDSCWTVVDGGVYDVTGYVDLHPGGAQKVLKLCGKDGSSAFGSAHGGEPKPEAKLASYRIGGLA